MKRNQGKTCPICREVINIDAFLQEDKIINCPKCNSKIKVVTVNPFDLQVVRDL